MLGGSRFCSGAEACGIQCCRVGNVQLSVTGTSSLARPCGGGQDLRPGCPSLPFSALCSGRTLAEDILASFPSQILPFALHFGVSTWQEDGPSAYTGPDMSPSTGEDTEL
jgi:hypothetical protein